MPKGPAERGVEATRAHGRAGARHAKSIDGAEHSGSIELVMAGRTRHRRVEPSRAVSHQRRCRGILLGAWAVKTRAHAWFTSFFKRGKDHATAASCAVPQPRQQVTRSTDGSIQVVGVNPINKRPLMLMQILQMAPSAQPRISRQLALPPIAGSWCH